jgi:hypothetical protein
MFTVMFRNEAGDETVLCDVREVRKVLSKPATRSPEADPTSRFYDEPGVYVQFDGGGQTHFGFLPPGAPVKSDEPPTIFVMNEQGATVARYRL